jgi:hypothetical protein
MVKLGPASNIFHSDTSPQVSNVKHRKEITPWELAETLSAGLDTTPSHATPATRLSRTRRTLLKRVNIAFSCGCQVAITGSAGIANSQ